MPDFIATAPDGRKFKITAPEGATPDQMRAYAEANMAKLPQVGGAQPAQQQPDNMLMSGLKGAGEGFARTVLGGQQLVGKAASAIGFPETGKYLQEDAQKGIASEAASTAADKKAHPWATEAGELLGGGVLPGGLAGKTARAAGPIAQAALSGALSGALDPIQQAGNYWLDKAKAIGIGTAAGSVLGTLAAKVGSPAVKGVSGDAKELLDAGVKLTPGQMIGGSAKGLEEKATSAPITGHFIANALHDTQKSFNIATINKALAPIGAKLPAKVQAGNEAVKAAQQAVSTAYDQVLSKMSVRADPTMVRGVEDVLKQANNGALTQDLRADLNAYVNNRIKSVFQGNTLDGKRLKAVEEDLRTEEATWRKAAVGDPRRRQYADAIAAIHSYVDDAIERQNPNFVGDKRKVDAAYAMLTRIEGAAAKRVTSEGVFTPGDLLGSIKSQESSVRKRAFAAGDSLMQGWAKKAQKVIGNRTPDSGTAGRLMAMHAAAGGLGAVYPQLLALTGAASLPYTSIGGAAVRGAATAAQAARKPLAKAVAESGLYFAPGAAQAANSGSGQ